MKYRKKPVVIEAIEWQGDIESEDEIMEFMGVNELEVNDMDTSIFIYTLEGKMKADVGDYIIKGINGEFYPCKPDIFEKTYELVND